MIGTAFSRSIKGLLVASTLAVSTAHAADSIIIVVDDDPGNDVAYSYTPPFSGIVANVTSPTAVADMLGVVNSDPNAAALDLIEIRIIDTDGAADVYDGGVNIARQNIHIVQMPNGSGTDSPASLVGTGTYLPLGLGAMHVQAPGFEIRGLSTAKRLVVDAGPHNLPITVDVNGGGGTSVDALYENIEITDPSGGGIGFDYLELNASFATVTPGVVFRGTRFTVGNGPQAELANAKFEDCAFDSPGFKVVQQGTNFTYTNCVFSPGAGGLHLGGETKSNSALFDGCTFNLGGSARLLNGQGPGGVAPINSTVTFRNPVFTGPCGDVALWLDNNNLSVTIEGTNSASPVDLDPLFAGGTLLLARINSGTLTLRNVKADIAGGAGFIDSVGDQLHTDLSILYRRCRFAGGSGRYAAADSAPSAFGVTIDALNTIWTGTTGAGAVIDPYGLHTGPDVIKLDHCTMAVSTANVLLFNTAPPAPSVTITNSIFDSTGTVAGAITGVVALAPTDVNNVRRGGGFLPGEPAGTMTAANFSLDSLGKLIPASASAIGRAATSTTAFDFEGDPRPLPALTVRDAGADESPLGPANFGWPINARKVATAPTIDGSINVAGEYSPGGIAEPVGLSLTGISALRPGATSDYFNGTNLSAPFVPGSVTSDADLSGTGYIVWDDDAIYVAFAGNDSDVNPQINPVVNGGDAFQLAIDYDDTNATDATSDGKVFIPSWSTFANTSDGQFFQQFWPTFGPNPMTDASWAVTTGAGTYAIEARIPWSAITDNGNIAFTKPFPPVDGQTAGMLFTLADHDEEGGGPPTEFSLLFNGGAGENMIGDASRYPTVTFVVPAPSFANGDANGDGFVDVADATAIYNFVAGISGAPAGDADVALPTPTVDAADADAIVQLLVNGTALPLP